MTNKETTTMKTRLANLQAALIDARELVDANEVAGCIDGEAYKRLTRVEMAIEKLISAV